MAEINYMVNGTCISTSIAASYKIFLRLISHDSPFTLLRLHNHFPHLAPCARSRPLTAPCHLFNLHPFLLTYRHACRLSPQDYCEANARDQTQGRNHGDDRHQQAGSRLRRRVAVSCRQGGQNDDGSVSLVRRKGDWEGRRRKKTKVRRANGLVE